VLLRSHFIPSAPGLATHSCQPGSEGGDAVSNTALACLLSWCLTAALLAALYTPALPCPALPAGQADAAAALGGCLGGRSGWTRT